MLAGEVFRKCDAFCSMIIMMLGWGSNYTRQKGPVPPSVPPLPLHGEGAHDGREQLPILGGHLHDILGTAGGQAPAAARQALAIGGQRAWALRRDSRQVAAVVCPHGAEQWIPIWARTRTERCCGAHLSLSDQHQA